MDSSGEAGSAEPERRKLEEALGELLPGEWRVSRGVSGMWYALLVATPQNGKLMNRLPLRGRTPAEVLDRLREHLET